MRAFLKIFSVFVLLHLTACQEPPKKQNIQAFDYILPNASYFIKINHPDVINKQNPVMIDQYLNAIDKKFLSKSGIKTPFALNIIQNNPKLKGFVVAGEIAQMDSLFNSEKSTYEKHSIYSEKFHKQNYYGTQINGLTFISNQKLLLENTIRDSNSFGRRMQNPEFRKGTESLDANAEMNIISFNEQLNPDRYFKSNLKIKLPEIATWQFLDLVDTQKPIATGIGLSQDSISVLNGMFKDIKPVKQNFADFMPYAISESIIFSFDDFNQFIDNLSTFKTYAPGSSVNDKKQLENLQALGYFMENSNRAVILQTESTLPILEEEPELVTEFNQHEIYRFPNPDLFNNLFGSILPGFKAGFFTQVDNDVLLSETQAYLEKVLNDLANGSVLSKDKGFQQLQNEIPDAYHLILFKNKLQIAGQSYMKAQTFKADDETLFTNLVLQNIATSGQHGMVEQFLSYPLNEIPLTDPQLVFNHKTKTYDIIYQDEAQRLTLVNLKGKQLWQTEIKDKILSPVKQVDLYRNRKLQYTFTTPHHWHVIDRLGRKVEKFPEHFMQKITQPISVFDYDKNRKYRFGITQGNKFRLFDNEAKKVKGFKVKTQADIAGVPQHFRIGSKDFIVMQDIDGHLYLLNRRGDVRIKVSKKFETTRNSWGVYRNKFVNIDDHDNLISIDLSGKVKTGKLNIGNDILSEIRYNTLAAVAGNKLLLNKKIIDLDLGTYERPRIYKSGNKVYVLLANTTNNKIYAFDSKGKLLPNFPIIGRKVLDFKTYNKARYLLVYDSVGNLIVYKF